MKISNSKISLIIPVFNIEEEWDNFFVNKYYDSLIELPIEVIIINDYSADNSLFLLNSLENDKIKILNNDSNKGPNFSRNIGIQNSSSEYLLFLDSDDKLNIDSLKKIIRNEKFINYDVLSFSFSFENSNNKPLKFYYNSSFNEKKNHFSNYLLGNYYRVSWGRLYKKEFLKINNIKFIEDKIHGRDILFCAKVFKLAKNIGFDNKILVISNMREGSFSRNYSNKNIKSAQIILNDMKKLIGTDNSFSFSIFKVRTVAYHYFISSKRLSKLKWKESVIELFTEISLTKFNLIKNIMASNMAYFLAQKCCNFLKLDY